MAPSKQYDEGGQLQLMEADRVEKEEECFESIDKLISQGINAGDVKKLQDAGIYTCNGLMMHTKKSLTGIKGLSEAKVDKICEAAEKLLSRGIMTGSDLLIKRKFVVRITTGSQALDELLGGGIETLYITEAFGEFRSGKTQLAHTLCVTTQLPLHMHGGNGKVAYIDTEGTFRPERIVPISERFGMDANAVLDNSLTGIEGLSEAKVDKICEAAEKLLSQGIMTGSDLLIKRKSIVRITTGSQALDELLGGGIETLCITEEFGEFRSGKTQLVHTLCVTTQLPLHMHGGNGKVAYIDTEGTFRPGRIVPISERFGMNVNAVLDSIIYAHSYTYEHQYNLLPGLAAKMAEEPFRLLIVDSVIALFRVDFSGRGELADHQQKLAQMLSHLTKIAEEFNVAVYITNQVIADPGGGMFITDPKKPAGGHVLANVDFSGRGELAERQLWISVMASYIAKNSYHIGGLLACSGHKSYHPFDPWKGYDIRNTVTRSLNGSPTELARSYDESVIHVMNWIKSKGTEISFTSVLGKEASLFTTPPTGTFHYLIKYEDEGVIAAGKPSLKKVHAASLVIDAYTGWCYAFVNANGTWVFQPKDQSPYIQIVGTKIIPVEPIYSKIAPDGMVEDIEIGIDPARDSCVVLSEYDGSTDPAELLKVMIAAGRAIFPICEGFKFRQVFELNSSVLRKGISTTIGKSELPETSLCVKGWDKISSAANGAIFHYLFHHIPMWPFRFTRNYGRIKTVEQAVKYLNIATYKSVNTRMSKRHERTQFSWSPVDDGDGEEGVHLLSEFDVSKLQLPQQKRFEWEREFFLGDRVGGPAHWTAVQFLNRKKPRELNPYRGTMPLTYGDKAPSSKLTKKVQLFSRVYPDGLVKLARAIRCLKK